MSMKKNLLTWILLMLATPFILAQEIVMDYPVFQADLDTVFVDFKVVKFGNKINLGNLHKESVGLQTTGYNGADDVINLVDVLDIRNYDPDYASGNYSIIVLADRSVSEEQMQAERQAITQLFQEFPQARFYVTAMDDSRTPTTRIQDMYQLIQWQDSCFSTPSNQKKFIYKALASVLQEVTDTEAHDFYPETPYNEDLKNDGTKKVLFLMTDGVHTNADGSYIGGADFFSIKTALISELNQKQEIQMNVVYFGDRNLRDDFQHEIQYVFKEGDRFLNEFDPQSIKEQLVMRPDPDAMDYRLVIVNKNHKLYDGQKKILHAFLEQGDIEAYGTRSFTLGTLTDPIVVRSTTIEHLRLLAMCLFIGLALTGLAYLFFRFLYPKWKFSLFKRRYVKNFEKSNILPTNASDYVAQKCYYCKDAFQPGEEIVTKCEHTMHYDCWKECGFQCPEYGDNCDNGPVFYNEDNIRDKRNIPHFLKWLVAGCLFGILGWLIFRLCTHNQLFCNIILNTLILSKKVGLDASGNTLSDKIHDLLFFGTIIGFFVTFGASWLLERRKKTFKRVLAIIGRACIGGLGGMLAFFIGSLLAIVTGKDYNYFIVDIIPWLLTGAVVGYVIAYHTEISLKRAILCSFLFAMLGFCILYLFSFENSDFEFRNIGLLVSTLCMAGVMLFAGGLYACIAPHVHRSEHYFIHVEGNLKGHDVAVYKWMNRVGGNRMVTIGRSDRCYIDMDWDQSEGIDGVQAEVYLENDEPYYKILSTNEVKRLSHGASFRIGSTTFTYVEKDRI